MNGDVKSSYWERKTFYQSYDLLIIGAGITGLMAGLFYQRQHPQHRVGILERGPIPRGASTRNAGFACIGSITEHVADLSKAPEAQIFQRIVRRYRGLQLLRDLIGDELIDYEPCGGHELFTTQQAFDEAAAYIDSFNGRLESFLGEEDIYTPRTLNGYRVIYNRLEGGLHPGKLMQQLIRQVNAAGVEIQWGSPVKEVAKEGIVKVKDRPPLRARNVLIATNAFTSQLIPEVDVRPGRGYVFVTNTQKELPWKGTFHHDRGYIYFRNIGKRLLIGGGRNLAEKGEETLQFGINQHIKEHLASFVSNTLHLSDWKIDQEWSGIMGFTQTKTPVIKQLDEHRFVAAGLSGMGIAIGSQVGKEAASLLSADSGIPGIIPKAH